MNNALTERFTKEKVEEALHHMAPLKSIGPYGFNTSFYQIYWHIVGDEITSVVLNYLNNDVFDHCTNFTYIVLIPKITNSANAYDFRPISLCDVIYKIASKVLANKLKQVLPHIISMNQNALMPGRLITNNIIVTYEALHSMNTRYKGCKGNMAVKLDISKAYDKL